MANPIIDVDSHWIFPWEFELDKGPLKRFAEYFKDGPAGLMTFFIAGDLMLSLPDSEKPRPLDLFPTRIMPDGTVKKLPDHWDRPNIEAEAAERIAWMDKVGIDFAIVNSGGFPAAYPLIDDQKKRHEYLSACNDELAARLHGYTDRLSGVTYADLTDLDWAVGELRRMRALGSRVFSIRAEPVNGRSLSHPYFDRLWSAITDLGMIVSLHIGLSPTLFGDWGRVGWPRDTPEGRGRFMRMANSQRSQAAEMFLSALLFGGVFERHPKLTILIAEQHAFWLPNFMRRMEFMSSLPGNNVLGPWGAPMSGGEYLRRQVRISPLPGLGDFDALDILEAEPRMIVFSSDYPHTEGNVDPINLYGPKLKSMDADMRNRFMGETMVESFKRVGDPIPVTA
jgi:predicted TIM-barrel fold metal-dependent hydrolase